MDLKSTSVDSEKLQASFAFLRWLLQGINLASHMHDHDSESKLLHANFGEDEDDLDESFQSSTLDKNISFVQLPTNNHRAKQQEAFTTNEEFSDQDQFPSFQIRKKSRHTMKASFFSFPFPFTCSLNFTFYSFKFQPSEDVIFYDHDDIFRAMKFE
jgi:hypothetical protein